MRLTVFLSSRFEEFADLRRAVAGRLQESDLFRPLQLDDGRPSTARPLDRSLHGVREADVVVLLLGRTYADDTDDAAGATGDDTDLSVTHREYREARAQGVPVLAWSTRGTPEPRAAELLAEVEGTYGWLSGSTWDDSSAVVDALHDWYQSLLGDADDSGTLEGGLEGLLRREWRYLGLDGLGGFRLPPERAVGEPLYVQVLERRRFAVASLTAGRRGAALEHLRAARSVGDVDWTTGYLSARLLAAQATPGARREALEALRACLPLVDDDEHAPSSLGDHAEAVRRRSAASLALQARTFRTLGDAARAHDAASRALEQVPNSRSAMDELVRAAAAVGRVEEARKAFEELARTYPDLAVRTLRAPEVKPVAADLARHAGTLVARRLVMAATAYGSQVAADRRPHFARDLEALRAAAGRRRDELRELAWAARQAVQLTSAPPPAQDGSSVDVREASAQLAARRTACVQRRLALLDELGSLLGTGGPLAAPDLERLHRQAVTALEQLREAGADDGPETLLLLQSRSRVERVVADTAQLDAHIAELDAQAAVLGIDVPGLVADLLEESGRTGAGLPATAGRRLATALERYGEAFSAFPNWTTPEHVPLARALPGDVTRVGPEDPFEGGLLAGSPGRRLVRLVERSPSGGRVSDLGLVLDLPLAEVAQLEQTLTRAVRAADRADAGLDDGPRVVALSARDRALSLLERRLEAAGADERQRQRAREAFTRAVGSLHPLPLTTIVRDALAAASL